jgi:hypothetical protein
MQTRNAVRHVHSRSSRQAEAAKTALPIAVGTVADVLWNRDCGGYVRGWQEEAKRKPMYARTKDLPVVVHAHGDHRGPPAPLDTGQPPPPPPIILPPAPHVTQHLYLPVRAAQLCLHVQHLQYAKAVLQPAHTKVVCRHSHGPCASATGRTDNLDFLWLYTAIIWGSNCGPYVMPHEAPPASPTIPARTRRPPTCPPLQISIASACTTYPFAQHTGMLPPCPWDVKACHGPSTKLEVNCIHLHGLLQVKEHHTRDKRS